MTLHNSVVFLELASFNTLNEAYLAKNQLEIEGIRCFLENESINLLYANALGSVKLKVPASEFEKAYLILNPKKAKPLEIDAPSFFLCPTCGQLNENFQPVQTESGLLERIAHFLGLSKPKIVCKHCKDTFTQVELLHQEKP